MAKIHQLSKFGDSHCGTRGSKYENEKKIKSVGQHRSNIDREIFAKLL